MLNEQVNWEAAAESADSSKPGLGKLKNQGPVTPGIYPGWTKPHLQNSGLK